MRAGLIPDSSSSQRNSVKNKMRSEPLILIPSTLSSLSHTQGISISNGKFIIFKLMYTLPPLFWFLDICFSNSFSAVVMPVTAPLLPPASLPATLLRQSLSLGDVCSHSPVGQAKLSLSSLSQNPDSRPQETLEHFHHPVSQTLKVSKPADQKTIRKTSLLPSPATAEP